MNPFNDKFMAACKRNDVEPVVMKDMLIFLCPKEPSEDLKRCLLSYLPSPEQYVYRFMEGPKTGTIRALRTLGAQAGAEEFLVRLDGHKALIEIKGDSPAFDVGSTFWVALEELLYGDKFFSGWTVKLNGQIRMSYDRKIAQEIASRGNREPILKDDILNLQITLGACESVDDFLKAIS